MSAASNTPLNGIVWSPFWSVPHEPEDIPAIIFVDNVLKPETVVASDEWLVKDTSRSMSCAVGMSLADVCLKASV